MNRLDDLIKTAHIFKAVTLTILCALVCVVGAPFEGSAAPVRSYEQQLEQVRLYINKEMYEAARTQLEQLKFTDQGRDDERVYTALAKVNYRLYNITEALNDLRNARQLTRDPKARASLSAQYEQWLNSFGLVRFEPLNHITVGSIELVRSRKLINRKRKLALEKSQKILSEKVSLPSSIYLPYGSYTANGVTFKLERNKPAPIVALNLTPLVVTEKPSDSESLNPWVYVGVGAATVIGAGLGIVLYSQDQPQPRGLTVTISDGR